MNDPTLVLRDIHQTPAPAWWPPAPGWWILVALLLAVFIAYRMWRRHKARKVQRMERLFDEAVSSSADPASQVAVMSQLLRRAARRRDRDADKLSGDAWLAFLDAGDPVAPFLRGDGRLLLEGGFQREADPVRVQKVQALVRARFLDWMLT